MLGCRVYRDIFPFRCMLHAAPFIEALLNVSSPFWCCKVVTIRQAIYMIRSIEEQRDEYARVRFMAIPLSGAIVWLLIGIAGFLLPERQAAWVLFIGTGSMFYLAVFIARFTGEPIFETFKPKNKLYGVFLLIVAMTLLMYAIAIPLFLIEATSLPLTIGVISGLMWIPFSWVIQHWVGVFHGITRALLILSAWHFFPEHRFVVIPLIIFLIYCITIFILKVNLRTANNSQNDGVQGG